MGILDFIKKRLPGRRRHEPGRDSAPFPSLMTQGQSSYSNKKLAHKPTPRNLRYFARTPYARRAINAIKNPIAMLDWEIGPIDGIELNSELERQIEVATYCFEHPNQDDSFRSMTEAVIEDILCGAGAIEQQLSGAEDRPIWFWPVDGLTIHIYPMWSGEKNEARYVQMLGYGSFVGGGVRIPLRNDELIYFRPNPSSTTPFGLGPLEVAFNSISRILGVSEFAGNVATNARPSIGLDLGDGADASVISAFRAFWKNEVEGQGTMPIWGLGARSAGDKTRGPEVLRLYPEGDNGLYLKYTELLKSEIATAFDLSPQNLGVERDVNRNTAEVGEDRDREHAIKPCARLYASYLTREALHGRLGFSQLEFRFIGLDPEDEEALAKIYEIEYKSNAMTPNEYRESRGHEIMESPWGDMVFADMQIAISAAKGSAQMDDPDLQNNSPEPKPKPKKKPAEE